MNIGTMNIDNLMESITEEEAIELTEILAKQFKWKGCYFYTQDIRDRLEEFDEGEVSLSVEEVLSTKEWEYTIESSLISEGFELLDEAIFRAELNKNKKGK